MASRLAPVHILINNGGVLSSTGVPVDRATGKIWMRDCISNDASAFLGGSTAGVDGTRVVATVSGHTMLSDTLTCWSHITTSTKQTSSTSQNQTATLAGFSASKCSITGNPASTAGVNRYSGSTCGGSPTAGSFGWWVDIGYEAGTPVTYFRIVAGGAIDPLYAFVGKTSSLCFPVTINNDIPAGAVGDPFTVHGFSGITYGQGGSVTLSLLDYTCP